MALANEGIAALDPYAANAVATGGSAVQGIAALDPFAPGYKKQPGYVARGFKGALKGAKAAAGGVAAAVGDFAGIDPLKDYGLGVSKDALAEASELAVPVESVKDTRTGGNFLKYAVGYTGGNLLTMLAGGALGRMGGAVAARALAAPAEKLMLKNAGMAAGLAGSGIAQEVGSIYPDAVEQGVSEPLARAITGGFGAGMLEFLPQLYLANKIGLLGKAAKKPGRAGAMDIAGNAAKTAATSAGIEGATEVAQTAIERLAAGHELTGQDATSAYLNAAALGGLSGGILERTPLR